MFARVFVILCITFSAIYANPTHLERYYEDIIDHSTMSVSFIGLTLTTKYKGRGCGGQRPKDTDVQVLAVDTGTSGRNAMTSKILAETFAPGLIITYRKHLAPHITLNVVFQGFLNWHKQEYARSKNCLTGHIEIPFGPLTYCDTTSDWNNAGFAYFRYQSSLNSIEVDFQSHSSPVFLDYFTLSASAGLRYIDFTEDLKIKAHAPTALSCYYVETKNNLIGVQMGGQFMYSSSDSYAWTLDLKGGLFVNLINAHPQLFDHNNSVILFNEKVKERTLSYMAELHPHSIYNITENFFIETAYQGLVLWNVSLATKFVTFSRDQTDIFTRSFRYYNAFQVGVGFRF
jgi:hypothetical protein